MTSLSESRVPTRWTSGSTASSISGSSSSRREVEPLERVLLHDLDDRASGSSCRMSPSQRATLRRRPPRPAAALAAPLAVARAVERPGRSIPASAPASGAGAVGRVAAEHQPPAAQPLVVAQHQIGGHRGRSPLRRSVTRHPLSSWRGHGSARTRPSVAASSGSTASARQSQSPASCGRPRPRRARSPIGRRSGAAKVAERAPQQRQHVAEACRPAAGEPAVDQAPAGRRRAPAAGRRRQEALDPGGGVRRVGGRRRAARPSRRAASSASSRPASSSSRVSRPGDRPCRSSRSASAASVPSHAAAQLVVGQQA